MKRVAALLLVLCAGCASPGEETLLEDSVWTDVRTFFTGRDNSAQPSAPTYTSTYAGSSADAFRKPPATSGQ